MSNHDTDRALQRDTRVLALTTGIKYTAALRIVQAHRDGLSEPASLRERNRFKEHLPHGLKSTSRTSTMYVGRTLHECPCGWTGWLPLL